MTRRLLVVTSFFPPSGGPGVQRWAKFVRYLPEFGFEPVVITASGLAGDDAPYDDSLMGDVDGVEIIRIPRARKAAHPVTALLRAVGNQLSPADRAWARAVVDRARGVQAIEVAAVTLGPYAIADVAPRLSRVSRFPIVLDFRDPWVLDDVWLLPTRLHRAHDRLRMQRAVDGASGFVLNTKEAARRFVDAFPHASRHPLAVIPNGFDAADFDREVRDVDGREIFTVLHAGTVHTEDGAWLRGLSSARRSVAGIPRALDLLPRSPVYVVEAIRRLLKDDPSLDGRLELVLVGQLSDEDRAVFRDDSFVRSLGYRTHAQTIELMMRADALFLPLHAVGRGRRVAITPGKTYEYLASGTPIVAAVPDSDTRDILLAAGNPWIAEPDDTGAIAGHLRDLIAGWRVGAEPAGLRPEVLATYERRHLTGRLAEFLERVVAARSRSR